MTNFGLLDRLTRELHWPEPRQVIEPTDELAAMLAASVREKIERPLSRHLGADRVRTGILTIRSREGETPQIQAIVCEFAGHASPADLHEAHRLAWNFCHAPILVTVDPTEVRTWTCYECPSVFMGQLISEDAELKSIRGDLRDSRSLADQASAALCLASLSIGEIIRNNPGRFRSEGRADRMLLENLKSVRRRLIDGPDALTVDLAHDLIARLMFIQFLFDRKDPTGRSALDADKLGELCAEGVLKDVHSDLVSVLRDKTDTYRFFRWLDSRFNGDLFPGKTGGMDGDEAEWNSEIARVAPRHLALLSDLVTGDVEIETGQLNLWRLYSFETMPLEFVSCIYEEFVTPAISSRRKEEAAASTGTHYTPIYLVDFVLDSVLPWTGTSWQVKIMDPACGSGVFLVRSFQRLIHRWRQAHPGARMPATVLTDMLTTCLFGIDKDPHAVRVASFSLYLTMCDEIDPREYWTTIRFPSLRNSRIVSSDFFYEGHPGFSTVEDAETYDVVVGNAPWGKRTMTEPARKWSMDHDWPIANKDVGVLFLAKSVQLLRPGGRLAMVQSAGTILLHEGAVQTRKRLRSAATIEEIVNFSLLRFRLFPRATSPSCSVTLSKTPPSDEPIAYVCPKLAHTDEDAFRIRIEKDDVQFVLPEECDDPWVWTVLMTAGRRDLALLRRLASAGRTLASSKTEGAIILREGVIPDENGNEHPALATMPFLKTRDFPKGSDLVMDSGQLPRFGATRVHRPTLEAAFALPQLIIKQSWRSKERRFQARLPTKATVCTQSYISVRGMNDEGKQALHSYCAMLNSRLAAYFLALTNGRMSYRPELLAGDFLRVPFKDIAVEDIETARKAKALDRTVEERFGLRDHERMLIEDAIEFSIPELLREKRSAGRARTSCGTKADGADDLHAYCEAFLEVLNASVGPDGGPFCASIIAPEAEGSTFDRVAAIHMGAISSPRIRHVPGSGTLIRSLAEWQSVRVHGDGTIQGNRMVTSFASISPGDGEAAVPTIVLVRPDQRRYWTRSRAMRDADEIVASGMQSLLRLDPPSAITPA